MFKKPFAIQNQNLLSKKDLKGLKSQLLSSFPGLSSEDLDELLPEGKSKVLKLDNRCLLYCASDDQPCFFDAEGRGELYPALTTLWQYPTMVPELTIPAPVSKFVLRGATLMLPGVIVPSDGVAKLGPVSEGQVRCVKCEGNPFPIAVGKMLVDQKTFETLQGKGLETLHIFKDSLWAHLGKPVPNAGFSEKEGEVTPCEASTFAPPSRVGGSHDAAANEEAPAPEAASTSEAAVAEAAHEKAPTDAGISSAPGTTRKPEDWTPDDLIDFCFLKAFKTSLTDAKALPVEASELYEKHMKPCRPEGTTLDVKKTSHKQIGKYLNAMRKAKAIDTVEKKSVVSVTKVDLKHKVFAQLEEKFSDELGASAAAAAESSAPAAASASTAAGRLPPPKISTVWKPTHYTEPLFKAMDKSKSGLYSWDEASDTLREYCKKEALLDDDDNVKLSEEILTILFKTAGAQKKGQTWPEQAEFADCEDKLQERLQEHTIIDVHGVGPTTRKGPPVKIEVSLSRKGAHNVTRICNLESYGLDPTSLGDELKKKLNCTVYIEDMPGKNSKDKMMQLQGHVNNELADFLLARYGIPKSMLSVK